jgi:Amt family ammonium transporter
MTGMLMTGIFGSKVVNGAVLDGQFLIQLKGMAIAVTYSFVASFIIFKIINLIVPIRVSQAEEAEGLDASQHDEKYLQGTLLVQHHHNGTLKEKEVPAEAEAL